ncbi:hypothetical protein GON03_23210 [Nocardioides sp. MAH-18]|uniref:Uncharacterized protein n=1 Tax=Nocardioides agri TaxID=2682843 RepID=A0A6L6XZB3_9ACTN|nr:MULTISPECIES: hypothetical protein [unclassified Nocardioides]MBA2952940.1 hypothetical protein [Nocardioides sp. CGMCC 1.13656]MVQ52102.1 hypothetical protein [Nocardioides sp. MAH-18]
MLFKYNHQDAIELTQAMLSLAPDVVATTPEDDDDDGVIPAELRRWLVQLRLLEPVPFAYLVADSDLLPLESIRWFYLDRRWTDALVQGVLSVGTANSDDRTHLAAQYPAIRDELDREERNRRRARTDPRLDGGGGPVSGFVLRSKAVSGWPAVHVRAFSGDPAAGAAKDTDNPPNDMEVRLLRLERLAPAVLLCLFDGIPRTVHIEEPRQGVQFGFDMTNQPGGTTKAQLEVRNAETFEYVRPRRMLDVKFRHRGASGVVDIKRLEDELADIDDTLGPDDEMNSGEYALQLVQFPWRQVWGDMANADEPAANEELVFKPVISYRAIVRDAFLKGD